MKTVVILLFSIIHFSFSLPLINGCSHIYSVADEMPEFPGGEKVLQKYIAKHLVKSKGTLILENGTVVLNFVVDTQGNVNDIKVIKGLTAKMNESAVNMVKGMPQWKPGKQSGIPVCVEYVLPVRFKK